MGGSQGHHADPFGLNFYGAQGGIGSVGGASRTLGKSTFPSSAPELYSWEGFENPAIRSGVSSEDLWAEAKKNARTKVYAEKIRRGWNPPTPGAVASNRRWHPTIPQSRIEKEFDLLLGGGSRYQSPSFQYEAPSFQYQPPSFRYQPPSFSQGFASGGIVGALQGPVQDHSGLDGSELRVGSGALAMDPEMSSSQSIIQSAILAISDPERHPNPSGARADFVERFGELAYLKLESRLSGGSPRAPEKASREGFVSGGAVPSGDGMSDSIPANIDGVEDVALSEGEFVVPADVVSGLGNGSTEAGAERLYELMAKVRHSRTGTTQQPPAINASEFIG